MKNVQLELINEIVKLMVSLGIRLASMPKGYS